MLIRCEKCSTLYELDDKLLPPQGAPVQCSKCQFVFKAYPAPPPPPTVPKRAANDTPDHVPHHVAPVEVEPDPPPDEPPPVHEEVVVREGGALAHSFAEHVGESAGAVRVETGAMTTARSEPADADAGRGLVPPGTPIPVTGGEEPRFTPDGRPIRKVPFPAGDPPQPGPRTPPLRGALPRGGRVRRGPVPWLVVVVIAVAVLVVAVLAWRTFRPESGGATRVAPAGQSRDVPQGGTPEPPAGK